MSKFYIPANSKDDWKSLLAEPEKQWKKGYSAMSLACSWQNADGFPESVRMALERSDIEAFQDIELLAGFPEHKVPLPGGSRPSQNDTFILARGKSGLVSITVEGKVSETFGPLISDWIKDGSQGKHERLNYLVNLLNLNRERIGHIRYQLLHRTASAVIEANRFCAKHALMLVHSFSPVNEGFYDFSEFANLFGQKAEINRVQYAGRVTGIELYLGWVNEKPC